MDCETSYNLNIPASNEIKVMTIHDLRTLLRSLGGTPSLKKRVDLINEIESIRCGIYAPLRSTRGRKSKDKTSPPLTYESGVSLPFSLSFEDCIADTDKKTVSVASGILLSNNAKGWFLHTYNVKKRLPDFYVSDKIINKYNLLKGDFIIGYAQKTTDASGFYLTEIVSVNYVETEQFKRGENFDLLAPSFPSKMFNFDIGEPSIRGLTFISPIGKGQRCVVSAEKNRDLTTYYKKLAVYFDSLSDMKSYLILTDERPELCDWFCSNINNRTDVVFSSFFDIPELHVHNAEMCFESAKRYVETGKDAVILISSVSKLYKAVSDAKEKNKCSYSSGEAFLKKLFGCAKSVKGGGSLTLVFFYEENSLPVTVCKEICGASNCRVSFVHSAAPSYCNPLFNVNACETDDCEYLFSEDKLSAYYKLKNLFSKIQKPNEVFEKMLSDCQSVDDLYGKIDSYVKAFSS